MLAIGVEHIGESLLRKGHCLTSYDELGIVPDGATLNAVITTAPEHLERRPDDGYVRERRATSLNCEAAARRLMQPLVDVLFVDATDEIRRDWSLFGINYYLAKQFFKGHQDFETSRNVTVVIASVSGQRNFVARDIEGQSHRYILTPEDVMLLDGNANPWHMATCTQGPSISVVADVQAVIRTRQLSLDT